MGNACGTLPMPLHKILWTAQDRLDALRSQVLPVRRATAGRSGSPRAAKTCSAMSQGPLVKSVGPSHRSKGARTPCIAHLWLPSALLSASG